MISMKPKKYFCTICNKGFRRKKQHFNHVMRNSCGKRMNRGTNKKQILLEPIIDQELVSLKPEIVHYQPKTTQYYGAPYQHYNIPTGNRHLRAGVPFISDPLRRTLQAKVLPKSMPSLGPIPTLSKHQYGLQPI